MAGINVGGSYIHMTRVRPSGRHIQVNGHGSTYFGRLSPSKPGYRTLNIRRGGENYYLVHAVEEFWKRFGNYEYSNGNSCGGWSGWFDSGISYRLGNAFKIFMSCTSYKGNFDQMGARVEIYNPNTGAIIAKEQHWGTGDNWTGTFTIEWWLNQNEINALGGYDATIKSRTRLFINRGSGGCGNRTYYDIHTYS
ncbi:hypothetical protein [Cetobacterium sp.]|uniref:hypothetical protein n=1 Tax=Cetobacterium sp. TaxID=2071632 RepID=UPI003F2E1C59